MNERTTTTTAVKQTEPPAHGEQHDAEHEHGGGAVLAGVIPTTQGRPRGARVEGDDDGLKAVHTGVRV